MWNMMIIKYFNYLTLMIVGAPECLSSKNNDKVNAVTARPSSEGRPRSLCHQENLVLNYLIGNKDE